MPMWLELILAPIALVFVVYAIDVHKDFRAMEKEFEEAKKLIVQLDYELQIANEKIKRIQDEVYKKEVKNTVVKKNDKIPAFLLADDPMDALFR